MLPVQLPSSTSSIVSALIRLFQWQFFQVNPNEAQNKDDQAKALVDQRKLRWPNTTTFLEFICVFAVIAAFAFTVVPGVNESHYLTKAKQFWNPSWCHGDIFLESTDAHYFFFATCGWLTTVFSLEATAWIGRIACWLGFAVAWVYLNHCVSTRRWFSVLSATLFMLLSSRFDMAGEWVVGGFEAKSVAYIFVVLGISWFIKKQIAPAIGALGIATALHAVIGGWAVFCFLAAIVTEALLTRSIVHLNFNQYSKRQWLLSFLLFGSFAAAGSLPSLLANFNIEPSIVNAANAIQVKERLAHHLLFQRFPAFHVGRFVILVAIWLFVTRSVFISREFQRLSWFCHASLVISLIGIVLSGLCDLPDGVGESANGLLRYYWFRFSDFAIPLGLSLFAVRLFNALFDSPLRLQRIMAWFSAGLLLLASLTSIVQENSDLRAAADKTILPTYPDSPLRTWQSYENWKKACNWIRKNTRSDSVFLTPVRQQTFKWYAHRAEFSSWKDMPQNADSLVEWRQRINIQRGIEQLDGGMLSLNDTQLEQLVSEYGVTHLLVEQSKEDIVGSEVSDKLSRIYPNKDNIRSTYVVYRINGF